MSQVRWLSRLYVVVDHVIVVFFVADMHAMHRMVYACMRRGFKLHFVGVCCCVSLHCAVLDDCCCAAADKVLMQTAAAFCASVPSE